MVLVVCISSQGPSYTHRSLQMIIQETLSSSNHVGITTNGMILGMLQYLIANILSTFFFPSVPCYRTQSNALYGSKDYIQTNRPIGEFVSQMKRWKNLPMIWILISYKWIWWLMWRKLANLGLTSSQMGNVSWIQAM
jgi:hypothetical protein